MKDLHSNLVIFKLMSEDAVKANVKLFTFQSGDIQIKDIQISSFYIHIYIPIW